MGLIPPIDLYFPAFFDCSTTCLFSFHFDLHLGISFGHKSDFICPPVIAWFGATSTHYAFWFVGCCHAMDALEGSTARAAAFHTAFQK